MIITIWNSTNVLVFWELGILDYLHWTDTLFRSCKSYDRHYMLLSATPAIELIPDEDKISCKKLDWIVFYREIF